MYFFFALMAAVIAATRMAGGHEPDFAALSHLYAGGLWGATLSGFSWRSGRTWRYGLLAAGLTAAEAGRAMRLF